MRAAEKRRRAARSRSLLCIPTSPRRRRSSRGGEIVAAVGATPLPTLTEKAMSAAPDWLSSSPARAPLIVSIPHAGAELDGREASLRRRVAGAPRRRLAYPPALRFRALARRDDRQNRAVALARRRQPRSERRVALSRPGDDRALPDDDFDGEPLYRPGEAPKAQEIAERRRLYFEPYHAALAAEIARLRAVHPRVALYDAHSIRSRIPRLFDGELPVFNLGTNSGASCDPALRERVVALLTASGAPFVADGRFKGGWITRRYGRPADGVHALQMELACRAYMAEPERDRRDELADPARRIPRRCDARDAEARARCGAGMDPRLMPGAFRRFLLPQGEKGARAPTNPAPLIMRKAPP